MGAYKTTHASTAEKFPAAKATLDKFVPFEGKQPGDPVKAASRIVEVISGKRMAGNLKGKVIRLPLGPDCVGRFEAKIKSLSNDLEAVREAAMSTNIE